MQAAGTTVVHEGNADLNVTDDAILADKARHCNAAAVERIMVNNTHGRLSV